MAAQRERHLFVLLKFSGEPAVKPFLTPLSFRLSQIYLIYHLFLDNTEYESIILLIVFWTLYALFRNVLRPFNDLNNSFFRV